MIRTASLFTIALGLFALATPDVWAQQVPSESPPSQSPLGQPPTQPPATQSPATQPTPPPMEPGQVADPSLALGAIVERHLAARLTGEPVSTVVARGKLTFMGLQLPLVISIARPHSSRLEADMAGTPMILATNGSSGWTVSPLQGMPVPEPLAEDGVEAVALFADFLWGLLDGYQSRGIDVSLRGVEKVANDETYALTLAGAGGDQRTLFLGGADFLERRLDVEAVFMGREQKLMALLDDYRDIGGLQIPHHIDLLSGGNPLAVVRLDQVIVNEPVDSLIFELPPPVVAPMVEPVQRPPGRR